MNKVADYTEDTELLRALAKDAKEKGQKHMVMIYFRRFKALYKKKKTQLR